LAVIKTNYINTDTDNNLSFESLEIVTQLQFFGTIIWFLARKKISTKNARKLIHTMHQGILPIVYKDDVICTNLQGDQTDVVLLQLKRHDGIFSCLRCRLLLNREFPITTWKPQRLLIVL